jgi:hypothetical protein
VAWPVTCTCTRQNFQTQLIINQLSPFLWQFIVSSFLMLNNNQSINLHYFYIIVKLFIHLEVSVLGNKSSILIFKLIYHITGSKSGPLDLMVFFAWFNFEMILLKFFFTLIGNSEWLLKDMHIQKCLCMEVNIVPYGRMTMLILKFLFLDTIISLIY